MNKLTNKQQEIMDYIWQHCRDYGYGPKLKTIQDQFKFKSPNAVVSHLNLMMLKDSVEVTPQGVYPQGFRDILKKTAEAESDIKALS